MMSDAGTYTTSDLGIASYLKLRGIRLLECRRMDSGRFHFVFEDPDTCRDLTLEFLESDFCKYDNITRNLKKLLFS